MKRALVLPTLLLLTACNPTSPGASSTRGGEPDGPRLEAPPGSRDDSVPEPFDRLLARARSYDARRRPVEALRLYRQALAAAPADLPAEERARLETRITELSFILGVPRSEVAAVSPASATPAPLSDAVQRARTLYARAQEITHQRPAEALELYRQVLRTIQEKDDPGLYWNAWQKVEDLSPEGQGPAAIQERQDQAEARLEAGSGGSLPDDGSLVAGAPVPAGAGRPDDVNLSQARASYIKGMEYVKAGDETLARQAFQQVLELIRESQDPELFRSARQNLEDLASRPASGR